MKQVLDYLVELREERRRRKLTPDSVPLADLLNKVSSEVRKDLNELYREKVISVYKTLNSQAIIINELQGTKREMAENPSEGNTR